MTIMYYNYLVINFTILFRRKAMENNEQNNHKFEPNSKYFTISVYVICIIAIAALIIKSIIDWKVTVSVIRRLLIIMAPFLIGIFIAFLLNPMVVWFQTILFTQIIKLKFPRLKKALSITLTYVCVIGLIAVLMVYIIPQISISLIELTNLMNTAYNNVLNFMNNFETEHPDWNMIDFDALNQMINNALPQLISQITNITTNLIPFLYTTSIKLVKWVLNIIIAVIVSAYILIDKENLIYNLKRFVYAILPSKGSAPVIQVMRESIHIFNSFIFGKTVDSLIIGLICYIAMITLQLKYAILISAIVGVTNMIPYFGPFIGGAIGAVILLIASPIKSIIFVVLILVLQQFDGLYLGPKILGESTGLKPLWVIFGITVGGSLFGIIGMFLGVPAVAVLSYIFNMYVTYTLNKKKIKVK